jgi:prepilin-type N-terminal cleavage/methylation domain-containing protein
MKSVKHYFPQMRNHKHKQKGMTLLETLVVLAILSAFLGLVAVGYSVFKKSQGTSEGRYMSFSLGCAMQSINAANFSATTITTLVNKDCFGDGSNVTGKGTTTASASSKLANAAYVVTSVGLSGGTNNGLQIAAGPISKRSCGGAVAALDDGSARIVVTPTGGTAVTVKPDNGALDDDAVGLACNSAETATVAAAAGRS